VYSRAERVFIAENYFAWKLSDAVREAFRNAHPDREVLNKNIVMISVRLHVKKGEDIPVTGRGGP
jgi:hypothetical protein